MRDGTRIVESMPKGYAEFQSQSSPLEATAMELRGTVRKVPVARSMGLNFCLAGGGSVVVGR